MVDISSFEKIENHFKEYNAQKKKHAFVLHVAQAQSQFKPPFKQQLIIPDDLDPSVLQDFMSHQDFYLMFDLNIRCITCKSHFKC